MARFLLRILCSLALVVAAWPAGASAAPCLPSGKGVAPVKSVKKACKMACCPKASAKTMACHSSAPQTELKAKGDCSCELKAALPPATPSEKATVSKVHLEFAVLPAPLPVPSTSVVWVDPIVFGGDSSPPGEGAYRPSSPRAPPVVRV